MSKFLIEGQKLNINSFIYYHNKILKCSLVQSASYSDLHYNKPPAVALPGIQHSQWQIHVWKLLFLERAFLFWIKIPFCHLPSVLVRPIDNFSMVTALQLSVSLASQKPHEENWKQNSFVSASHPAFTSLPQAFVDQLIRDICQAPHWYTKMSKAVPGL